MTEDYQGLTPPPELVKQWEADATISREAASSWTAAFATRAAQWGADQELEACVEWLPSDLTIDGESLRDVRRPKPPSLAEEALEITGYPKDFWSEDEVKTIRRALKRLQELEANNG